jgi:hypothetical protein
MRIKFMKKSGLIILIVFLSGLAFTLYLLRPESPAPQETSNPPSGQRLPVEAKETTGQPPAPPLQVEVPPVPQDTTPLPSLESADEETGTWLSRLLPDAGSDAILAKDHLLQRFVLMVHSLTENKLPLDKMPLKAVGGSFRVMTKNGRTFIDPQNDLRYAPYVNLAAKLPVDAAVAAYTRLYPLLQQAYEELGVSSTSFHRRLLEVIDHLLATPEVKEPIPLVQPHVLYRFADPELEALSSGQKILIRMGTDNAAVVKGKLLELREKLSEQRY